MDISILVDTFDQLVLKSRTLASQLHDAQPHHWIPLSEEETQNGVSPLAKANAYFQDFWYQNGQDGRETRSTFGLVAVDDDTLVLARAINALKDELKKHINQLQKYDKDLWLQTKGELNGRHTEIRESLYMAGLARLHLKQTWRHIPIIERVPNRVGFNWYSSGRSIQKITIEQAEKALLNMDTGSDHIQTQLNILGQLRPDTPLAKVQTLAPTMRANVFFDDQQSPDRLAMNVSLPLLIKAAPNGKLPSHNQPELAPPEGRQRAVRSDRRIEDDPFLPSIRVHRYL